MSEASCSLRSLSGALPPEELWDWVLVLALPANVVQVLVRATDRARGQA
jgi:hypothetical protein